MLMHRLEGSERYLASRNRLHASIQKHRLFRQEKDFHVEVTQDKSLKAVKSQVNTKLTLESDVFS